MPTLKLKVIETVAPDTSTRCQELLEAQCFTFRRPFGVWQYESYFARLAAVENELQKAGDTRSGVRSEILSSLPITSTRARKASVVTGDFQKTVDKLIAAAKAPTYYHEARMRSKLFRWGLPGIPREVETLAFKRFARSLRNAASRIS